MPHLLLTRDFPPIGGGISRMMSEVARRYPAGALVVSTGSHAGSARFDAAFPHPVDRLPVESRRLRAVHGWVSWCRRAAVLARAVRPELVWCGDLKPSAYPANWVTRKLGIPHGIFLHGTELLLLRHRLHSTTKRLAGRSLLGAPAALVAVSRWTADLCRTVLGELGVDPDAVEVRAIPLGTDPVHFRPGLDSGAARERYGLGSGRWLLTVARLAAHKGIDTGLRVLAALRDEVPELRYAVVGSGVRQRQLEQLARELGVAERVRFLTQVPDSDLPALYNAAEIYLGLSRPTELMVEGFGISLTEASACGVPVIGGSGGGIPDAVRDGETGLLVDASHPEPVLVAVRRLLGDRELARRMGAAGRRAVETYYNWDRVAADVIALGREVGLRNAASPGARISGFGGSPVVRAAPPR